MSRWVRTSLIALDGFVALTAIAGGAALVVATATSATAGGILPELTYLDGSPFRSYLVPGILLAVVVGGTHAFALTSIVRRRNSALVATVVAAFGLDIWIFVELIFIPFSFLQVVYFAAATGEIGLVLLALGLLDFRKSDEAGLPSSPRTVDAAYTPSRARQ